MKDGAAVRMDATATTRTHRDQEARPADPASPLPTEADLELHSSQPIAADLAIEPKRIQCATIMRTIPALLSKSERDLERSSFSPQLSLGIRGRGQLS
jgi:hypothetical protein